MKALIFDCDGVLVDTERDGHRVAFNRGFAAFGLSHEWDEALYGELLAVAGGKERMRHFFNEVGWPAEAAGLESEYVAELHLKKSAIYQEMIAEGALPLRSGINRIVDEATEAGLRLAVCSTSRKDSVLKVMDLMGAERKARFEQVLAGDVVGKKKPDPEVYLLALEKMGLEPAECMVVEDSRIGMLAALAAGMKCFVTLSTYTVDEDFTGALKVVSDLGDPPNVNLTVEEMLQLSA